ncbi:serine protease [Mycoplasmatota bacterium]|nr:serine protease [Mycoplasmatota bacterium]
MKKVFMYFITLILVLTLMGCQSKSYDDLYEDYDGHLVEQQSLYQTKIDFIDTLPEVTIKAVVSIESNFILEGVQNLGSGAVIDQDENYYYILTNNHVVTYEDKYANQYVVYNYLNEELTANLLFASEDYDLALLSISKVNDLNVFTMDLEDISNGDELIIMGYPNSQNHAITMGYFSEYAPVVVDDETSLVNKVKFDVLISSVPVKSGSSGSAIFNEDLKLVGLIYAGRFANDDEISTYSYAIPSLEIVSFLTENNYQGGIVS